MPSSLSAVPQVTPKASASKAQPVWMSVCIPCLLYISTPVQKITIVPHTQGALGYTLHLPEEDKNLQTRDELLAEIATYMGGRAAEEVVLHTMTNGAAQDIQQATSLARNMAALYGMSDKFGMMALASRRNQYLDGGYGIDCAQDTAADLDRDVMEILRTSYEKAVKIIQENREDMDKVCLLYTS